MQCNRIKTTKKKENAQKKCGERICNTTPFKRQQQYQQEKIPLFILIRNDIAFLSNIFNQTTKAAVDVLVVWYLHSSCSGGNNKNYKQKYLKKKTKIK